MVIISSMIKEQRQTAFFRTLLRHFSKRFETVLNKTLAFASYITVHLPGHNYYVGKLNWSRHSGHSQKKTRTEELSHSED